MYHSIPLVASWYNAPASRRQQEVQVLFKSRDTISTANLSYLTPNLTRGRPGAKLSTGYPQVNVNNPREFRSFN